MGPADVLRVLRRTGGGAVARRRCATSARAASSDGTPTDWSTPSITVDGIVRRLSFDDLAPPAS
jgi:hypothetical protein